MRIILIILLIGISLIVNGQLPANPFPTQNSTGLFIHGWDKHDSGNVSAVRDTFYARYIGTRIVRILGGDTSEWFYGGNRRWFKLLKDGDISAGSVTNVATGLFLSGGPITTTGTIIADSAAMALYFLRRKDSTLYTTVTRLADTAAAIRAAFPTGNISGSLTAGRVTLSTGAATIGDDADLTYNSSTNLLTSDSLRTKKAIPDSIRWIANSLGYARIGAGIIGVGNSMLFGTAATTYDSSFAAMIADTLQVPLLNLGLASSGILYSCTKHDSLVDGRNNSSASLIEVGYNDVILTSNLTIAYKKIASGIKAIFVNHFADEYAPASNDPAITRYGTWTLNQDAKTWGGKTLLGATTTTLNDSIVYKFYGPSAGVVFLGGDSTVFNSSIFEVFIDGISQGQFNTNRITDGSTVVGKVNSRLPYAYVISGLSSGLHSMKIVNVAARTLFVDYFATLSPNKTAYIIFQIPNPSGGSAGNIGQANQRIDSVYQTMPSGFPVLLVRTNNFYNPATGASGDGVHPNNTGMKQIVTAFRSVYDSACLHNNGMMIYDGQYWWITDRGYKKLPTWATIWNKGEVSLNAQGYINIPEFQSYQQNNQNALSNNFTGLWVRIGADALKNQTTGTFNTAGGVEASRDNTTGALNSSWGARALRGNLTGGNNTAIGANASREHTANNTTTVGANAGFWSKGDDNVYIGYNAFMGTSPGSAAALRNVMIGSLAGFAGTSANRNVYIGYAAATNGTTGANNIVIGYDLQLPSATTTGYMSIGNAIFASGLSGTGIGTTLANSRIGIHRLSPVYGLDIDGSVGIDKDSIPIASSTNGMYVLLVDTTVTVDSNKVKRILPSALSVTASNAITKTGNEISVGGDFTASTSIGNIGQDFGLTISRLGTSNATTLSAVSSTGNAINATSTSGVAFLATTNTGSFTGGFTLNPATTNTIDEVLRVTRTSSGTPANGLGAYIGFTGEVSDNSSQDMGRLSFKWTDVTLGTRTSAFQVNTTNSGASGVTLNIEGDGSITTYGRRFIAVNTSAAASLTLGNAQCYVGNGTTSTWTLPPVSGTTGLTYILKNIGSGTITVNADSGNNEIYSTSAVNTYSLTAGSSIILVSNGTYFTVN